MHEHAHMGWVWGVYGISGGKNDRRGFFFSLFILVYWIANKEAILIHKSLGAGGYGENGVIS